MLIDYKKLKKVIVETQSGQVLGKVHDFQLDTDTGIIVKYEVKSGMLSENLLIDKDQIINFDENKMVVEDGVVKVEVKEDEVASMDKIEGVDPVITSKAD